MVGDAFLCAIWETPTKTVVVTHKKIKPFFTLSHLKWGPCHIHSSTRSVSGSTFRLRSKWGLRLPYFFVLIVDAWRHLSHWERKNWNSLERLITFIAESFCVLDEPETSICVFKACESISAQKIYFLTVRKINRFDFVDEFIDEFINVLE